METEFYETLSGACPVEEFLEELGSTNIKLEAKALRAISLLEEFGTKLREPTSKPLEDGRVES